MFLTSETILAMIIGSILCASNGKELCCNSCPERKNLKMVRDNETACDSCGKAIFLREKQKNVKISCSPCNNDSMSLLNKNSRSHERWRWKLPFKHDNNSTVSITNYDKKSVLTFNQPLHISHQGHYRCRTGNWGETYRDIVICKTLEPKNAECIAYSVEASVQLLCRWNGIAKENHRRLCNYKFHSPVFVQGGKYNHRRKSLTLKDPLCIQSCETASAPLEELFNTVTSSDLQLHVNASSRVQPMTLFPIVIGNISSMYNQELATLQSPNRQENFLYLGLSQPTSINCHATSIPLTF